MGIIQFHIVKSLEEMFGVAAIAISVDTVAKLDHVKIADRTTPCKNFHVVGILRK